MGSYDDTIAVGRVLYAGNLPIVPPDECWIPAKTNPIKLSIAPVGGIHIFIGETVDSDGNPLVSNADATADEQDAVAKIRSEMQELPKEDSALDLEKSKPTQSAPEQEIKVEDQCRSAWVSHVLEKQRCHSYTSWPIPPEPPLKKPELVPSRSRHRKTTLLRISRRLSEKAEDKITEAQQEVDKIWRETIAPRKITFATPTEQQPYATPKDNMKKAAEILKKKDEEIDIDYAHTLVASAMKQQSKADTSRKLESSPEHCISTAQKDAYDNRHRYDESRTGSSERRRKTREHPNPISVPSKTPPSDPRKGKDAMYTGKD
ncbi:hypothetical protein QYE76_005034 [Lolium multiflorum]|uniref:Uncharacterized protein n=1 Tax=Lolium multiflorum TaxID=4521 RepID=A0AAD8RTY4_LOLMU|nr:hypothetical protein QYE76_005034 [Lolium multiflorum]